MLKPLTGSEIRDLLYVHALELFHPIMAEINAAPADFILWDEANTALARLAAEMNNGLKNVPIPVKRVIYERYTQGIIGYGLLANEVFEMVEDDATHAFLLSLIIRKGLIPSPRPQ